METKRLALVLGATGGIGGEMARQLSEEGWRVRALHRSPDSLANRDNRFEWQQGDAINQADVARAAAGASLIVHAVNPPGYKNWSELVLPMIDNSIAAARASGARIVLPGTVYNYGPETFPALLEQSPQRPVTRKGKIRVELERRLQAAAPDVRTLVVRAGDFFGPSTGSTWFAGGLVKPGKPTRSVLYPGKRGIGHQWAYLPDVARTMIELLQHEDQLAAFDTFHMDGHWDADGTRMIDAIRRAVTADSVKTRRFPWWLMHLIAPFSAFPREVIEMQYLWQQPIRLDNARLLRTLGHEPRTPLDIAIKTTLKFLGSL